MPGALSLCKMAENDDDDDQVRRKRRNRLRMFYQQEQKKEAGNPLDVNSAGVCVRPLAPHPLPHSAHQAPGRPAAEVCLCASAATTRGQGCVAWRCTFTRAQLNNESVAEAT